MGIYLSTSGVNLSLKPIAGQQERLDRDKIYGLKGIPKIPIYDKGLLKHIEVPKEALRLVLETWDESEILIDKKAQPLVNDFKFNSIPLTDLMIEEVTTLPADSKYHQLKETQEEFCSIDHRKTNLGAVLETGSGKTLCSLLRAANVGFNRILVLTAIDIFPDWVAHFRIVFGEDVKYVIYDGPKAKRDKIDLLEPTIVLSNYEKLKELKSREDLHVDCLILDECHLATNPSSKTFSYLKVLASRKEIVQRILVTATPIEEQLDPLWGILHILNPTLVGSLDNFLSKFQHVLKYKEIEFKKGGIKKVYKKPIKWKTKNKDELRRLLSTILYQKDTSNSFNFEQVTKTVQVDLTPKQGLAYRDYVDIINSELDDGTFFQSNSLEKTLRLLQIADGLYNIENSLESAKLDYLKEYLNNSQSKVIAWSRFKAITNILGELFPAKGIVLNGSRTKNQKRLARYAFQGCRDQQEEEEFYQLLKNYPEFPFKEPAAAQFLFATFGSRSGLGMNLSACNDQIIVCAGESGRNLKQVMGRIKRTDSKFDVINTTILTTKGTIEPSHVVKVLTKIKKAANILNGDEVLDTKISEIISLIRNPSLEDLYL